MSVPPQHAQNSDTSSVPHGNRGQTPHGGTHGADDAVAQIKARLPIEDVIGETVALKPAGHDSLKGLCPFHSERTPSFHVSAQKGVYHCFSCGAKGDIFEFVMKMQNLEFREVLELLAARAGVVLPERGERGKRKRDLYNVNDLAQAFFAAQLADHPEVQGYLTSRGFTGETVEAWGLGYAPEGWTHLTAHARTKGVELDALEAAGLVSNKNGNRYDFFRNRVTIPIRDVFGRVVSFTARTLSDEQPKYLNTRETAVFHKSELIFGLDKARVTFKDKGAAILVEGQMDVIAAHQAGHTNTVGLQSSSLTDQQLKKLERYGAVLYSALDSDSAGQEATLRLLNTVKRRLDVRVVSLNSKDPAEMLQADPESFGAALEAAQTEAEWRYNHALQGIDPRTPKGRDKFLEILKPGLSDMGQPGSGHELRALAVEAIGADVTTRDLKVFADGKEITLDASLEVEEDAEERKTRVRDRVTGEVEPFPLEVLPPSLQVYAKACAVALPVPLDFMAVPMLVTAATAIGYSRKIVIKDSWHEGARLWAAVVGDPGSRKSAALRKALDPLSALQKDFMKRHAEQLEIYKAQLKQYDANKLERKKGEASSDHPGSEPEMQQLITNDATLEALIELHVKNPRGLLFQQDELAGWIRGMDQYKSGKGNDRQKYLSMWSGESVYNNRKNKPAEVLDDPYVSVVGGIQPDILPALQPEQGADGFIDRILFGYPKPISLKRGFSYDDDVSDEVVAGYRRVINTLWKLEQVVTADGPQPKPLKMTPAAKITFQEWMDEHNAILQSPDLSNRLKNIYGKMQGYCARFALILHLVAYADGVEPDETISITSVQNACALTEYFMSHAARVHAQLTDSAADKILKTLYDYIDRQPQRRCTPRDLVHAKVSGCRDAKTTRALLQKLTENDLGQLEPFKRPSGQKSEIFVLNEKSEGVA